VLKELKKLATTDKSRIQSSQELAQKIKGIELHLIPDVMQGIKSQLRYKSQYHEQESNERIEFVDILTRRYLFETSLLNTLPSDVLHILSWEAIDEYEAGDIHPVPLDDQEHLTPTELEQVLAFKSSASG